MRVLLTGGGSGGHIYPALAIAAEILRRRPQCELLYAGTASGLESRIVPRSGLPFVAIRAQGLMGKGWGQKVAALWALAHGFLQADSLLARFRPQVVVGTGGYVAAPVGMAAVRRRIPLVIQEQNVVPGATNRLLARWAQWVCVPFAEAGRHFPRGTRIWVTGNPVRAEILQAERREARARMGIGPQAKVVLVTGGSQGAERLNRATLELARVLADDPQGVLLWACGTRYHGEMQARLRKQLASRRSEGQGYGQGGDLDRRIRLWPYIEDMASAYAAADLYVGRAGATTLAEITARGLPAVLIPSPHVAHQEQEHNARVLEGAGAARVLTDGELTGQRLAQVVRELLGAPSQLRSMAEASRRLGKTDAAAVIAQGIIQLAEGSTGRPKT